MRHFHFTDHGEPCLRCKGKGYETDTYLEDGYVRNHSVRCDACDGSGRQTIKVFQ